VDIIRLVEAGSVVTRQEAAVDMSHLVGAVVVTVARVEAAGEEVMVVAAPIVHLRVPAPAMPGECREDEWHQTFRNDTPPPPHFGFHQIFTILTYNVIVHNQHICNFFAYVSDS
jgi:hypothetical protein